MQRMVGVLMLALAVVLGLPAPAAASNDDYFSQQWTLAAIGAEAAWNEGTGAGTVIAIVDTGVDLDHPDLVDKLVPGASFLNGSRGTSAEDDNGHGTHLAGIAAASTGNDIGIAGVAPDARIMPVKVLDSSGSGKVVDVEAGIKFAADNGADVINLSFGEESVGMSPGFTRAIQYAWDKGAIPVLAAGNQVARQSLFTNEPVLVVTATTSSDTRPSYASGVGNAQWGMAAPGGDGDPSSSSDGSTCDATTSIISTYANSSYVCLVGTSMAAPHVAGAAAVLRGMGLSPQQVVDQLLATADDIGAAGKDSTFGSGRLNLARAVQAAAPPITTPATTEAPASITAAPTTVPPTTEAPTTAPPTTTLPSPTVALPPNQAEPVAPPDGRAIALLPDDGDGTRYVLAAPAGLLAVGVGFASWRMRRQFPWG
ncbi:hypothetical protein BH24ACT1_BH24ACT1_06170 [soil metagenome]